MATFKRGRIVIAFQFDFDAVPGWGHTAQSWIDLATQTFTRQSHYNTTAETLRIDEMPKPYVEGKGYVQPEFPTLEITEVKPDALTIADYEQALQSKRDAIRAIDVAMHGEENAAKQASAIDLIEPAKALRAASDKLMALRLLSSNYPDMNLLEALQQIDQ